MTNCFNFTGMVVSSQLKYRDDPDISSSLDEQQSGLALIQKLFESVELVGLPGL